MSQAAKRLATYADVLAAPPGQIAQILGGELHLHPRPARRHTRSASALAMHLGMAADFGLDGKGGDWIILLEPELHLGSDIVVPDLAGWRVERFPGDIEDDDPFFTVAPDWICEILSPSTARTDRVLKLPIYARENVAHAWLVDPRDRFIEVFRRNPTAYELVGTWGGDEGPFALEPFETLPLPAAAFWGRSLGR
jgi:Uma2 family endonuclease